MLDVIQPVLALWRSPPMVHIVGIPMLADCAVVVPCADDECEKAEPPGLRRVCIGMREGCDAGCLSSGRGVCTYASSSSRLRGFESDSHDSGMGTDTSDQEELGRESGHAEETGVAVHAPTRLLYAEYLAIGRLLVEQLVRGEELGVQVKESDLIEWYRTQAGDAPDEELRQRTVLVQKVLRRMIDLDRSIVVSSGSLEPQRPEERVLTRHPKFPVTHRNPLRC